MNAICYIIPCQFSNLRNLTGSAQGRIDLYQSSKHPEVQCVALASGFPVIHHFQESFEAFNSEFCPRVPTKLPKVLCCGPRVASGGVGNH